MSDSSEPVLETTDKAIFSRILDSVQRGDWADIDDLLHEIRDQAKADAVADDDSDALVYRAHLGELIHAIGNLCNRFDNAASEHSVPVDELRVLLS
jgi:hypothetical protein